MPDSPNLILPYIQASQAQKHITHNEAIKLLDGVVQLAVISRVLTAPPGSPVDGDRYIVASSATGIWAGWDLNVAYFADGAWTRLVPRPGWNAYSVADSSNFTWNGSAWIAYGGPEFLDTAFALFDDVDPTKKVNFDLSNISTGTTRTVLFPNGAGELVNLAATQTINGAKTFSGTFAVTATTATLGSSTAASTLGIGTGATLNGVSKTVNVGTGGVSGSTTTINIGSATAGALGTTTLSSPTVTFAATNTLISILGTTALTGTATNATLLYLGLGGATADSYNRFSINTPSLLLNNAGTSIDMTFNKNAAGNDATLSFKTGFSARAIAGLAGSDDFTLKVSPNGSSFFEAFTVARATGVMTLGAEFVLPEVAVPVNPGAGKVTMFGRSIAGRIFPAFMGPSGLDSTLQPLLARNKVGYWNPQGNSAVLPGVFGFTAPVITGFTETARNVAATNVFTRMRRIGFVSAATAAAVGHWRTGVSQFTVGNGSGVGGFTYIIRFGISDAAAIADARMFMGMGVGTLVPTNIEPSTLVNVIGIGCGAADTTLSLYYGGSAAQTPIALGASFPANTRNVDMYELALFAAPNSTTVQYEVTRLNTGDVAKGTLSGAAGTVLPAATTLLGPWGYRTNNASALACAIDVASAYIETDY